MVTIQIEMKPIEAIRAIATDLAEKIDVPSSRILVPSESPGDGSPHFEIQGDKYAYVVSERGIETERRETTSLDELLYWIFATLTHEVASDYEISHRIAGEDSRRLLFSYQLMLLEKLNPAWALWKKREIDVLLARFPFY